MRFIQVTGSDGTEFVLNLDRIQFIDCRARLVVTDAGKYGGKIHLTKESLERIHAAISNERGWV